MKKIIQSAVLASLAFFFAGKATAQSNKIAHKEQGFYTLGLNGGLAYQQSDVLTDLSGLGFGLTYGKNLIYTPDAPFSIDLRSRFQIARSFGKDIRPAFGISRNDALNGEKKLDYTAEPDGGFVYANHKTFQAEAGMEGVITLNGLREATGVGIALTGGVGLDWYKASIDQQNGYGLYSEQYKGLDREGSRSYTLSQLNNIRDGIYETPADEFGSVGKFGIMSSLGFELDYDLTPSLALGLGHRITFSGTDLLDGQQWTNDNALTGNNDILHYTSIGFKYTFDQENKKNEHKKPKIELITPYAKALKTRKETTGIKAKIHRVDTPFDVFLKVNNREIPFNFNKDILVANLRLKPGKNTIMITAHNEHGFTNKIIYLDYEPERSASDELEFFGTPEIVFIDPDYEGAHVDHRDYEIRAKVRLIEKEKDITLRLNGKKVPFDYDKTTETLKASVGLRKGKNILEIKAVNPNGGQEKKQTLVFEPRQAFPSVRIISPLNVKELVHEEILTVQAKLEHVAYSTDIQLMVNGIRHPNFFFDVQTGQLKAKVELRKGNNQIEIKAVNSRGTAVDLLEVQYQPNYFPERPQIIVQAPAYQETNTREERVVVQAVVYHVRSRSDIRIRHNGLSTQGFEFNPSSGIIKHLLHLKPGLNQVLIEANNGIGREVASFTINFELPMLPPVVFSAPVVEWTSPRNKDVFEERRINVRARLSGIAHPDKIEFSVNRENCTDFQFNPATGLFRARIKLREGENVLLLKAVNAGGVDRQRIKVFYEVPVAPEIKFRAPDFERTNQALITIKAKVEHLASPRSIQLFLNDQLINDFSFRNEMLESTLRLQEGQNEILLIAENRFGQSSRRKSIRFIKPTPPVITFNQLGDNQIFNQEQIQLEGRVNYIQDKNDLRVFFNGRATGSFDWKDGLFSATLNLKEGTNIFMLKAENQYGTEEVDFRLIYRQPLLPKIAFISHDHRSTVEESNITLKATLKNVRDKADLSLSLNGREQATFTFRNTIFKSPLRLQNGRNVILLSIHSEEGKIEKELILYFKSTVEAPRIDMPDRHKFKEETSHALTRIKLKIERVRQRNHVRLTLNDQPFRDFRFEPNSGWLTASVPLKMGPNTLQVTAKNTGGTTEYALKIFRRTGSPVLTGKGSLGKTGGVKLSKKGNL